MDGSGILGALAHGWRTVFGGAELLAPEYLLSALLAAWVVWRARGRPGGRFRAWAFPKAAWSGRSHALDLKLFVVGRGMALLGVGGRLSLAPLVAAGVAAALAPVVPVPSGAGAPVLAAVAMFLAADLTAYALHRTLHVSPALWPLHAVHHAAETMTPLTAYRQHPAAVLLSVAAHGLGVGAAQGVVVAALDPGMGIATIAGVNAAFVLASLALANLHHSHVWLGFPPWLERVLISPAMHQLHHSTEPAHHGRNYGQTLAVWDWVFGSWHGSKGVEGVRIGLTDPDLADIASHDLRATLAGPFRRRGAPSSETEGDRA